METSTGQLHAQTSEVSKPKGFLLPNPWRVWISQSQQQKSWKIQIEAEIHDRPVTHVQLSHLHILEYSNACARHLHLKQYHGNKVCCLDDELMCCCTQDRLN